MNCKTFFQWKKLSKRGFEMQTCLAYAVCRWNAELSGTSGCINVADEFDTNLKQIVKGPDFAGRSRMLNFILKTMGNYILSWWIILLLSVL